MRTVIVFAATLFVFAVLVVAVPDRYGIEQPFFAQIGISVGVNPNPYNTLAQQLDEKEREIAARERALDERSQSATTHTMSDLDRTILVLLGLLFLLILINLWLDHRARQRLARSS
jgi:hypothetical protein